MFNNIIFLNILQIIKLINHCIHDPVPITNLPLSYQIGYGSLNNFDSCFNVAVRYKEKVVHGVNNKGGSIITLQTIAAWSAELLTYTFINIYLTYICFLSDLIRILLAQVEFEAKLLGCNLLISIFQNIE